MREKCPSTEFFLARIFRIRTEYGDLHSESLYSVRIRENTIQKSSLFGHFSRSGNLMTFRVYLHSRFHNGQNTDR